MPSAKVELAGDEYLMGFFAGITVEVDDVVIGLNGCEIAMSREIWPSYSVAFLKGIVSRSSTPSD